MQVEIDVPNKNYRLSPGMFADVTLKFQNRPHALTVPVTALHRSGSSATVLMVDSSNHVRQSTVQTGVEDPDRVEITAGVNEGDRVIVGNLTAYQSGELVRPKPSSMANPQWAGSGGER
jgi:multidrug efflux pump subunit AcrA (membrane-fusion protein)